MTFGQAKTGSSRDPRIGACVYLLHGLLQRLDQQQPGLIADLTKGVARDRAAMEPDTSASAAHGCEIADEALRMLRLMSGQLRLVLPTEPDA